jgi:hypothetical protein
MSSDVSFKADKSSHSCLFVCVSDFEEWFDNPLNLWVSLDWFDHLLNLWLIEPEY